MSITLKPVNLQTTIQAYSGALFLHSENFAKMKGNSDRAYATVQGKGVSGVFLLQPSEFYFNSSNFSKDQIGIGKFVR